MSNTGIAHWCTQEYKCSWCKDSPTSVIASRAIVAAEMQGIDGVGLSSLPGYALESYKRRIWRTNIRLETKLCLFKAYTYKFTTRSSVWRRGLILRANQRLVGEAAGYLSTVVFKDSILSILYTAFRAREYCIPCITNAEVFRRTRRCLSQCCGWFKHDGFGRSDTSTIAMADRNMPKLYTI